MQFILGINATIREAMVALETTGSRIILIQDNNKLLGVISDGDIRRGILNGQSGDDTAKSIMNTDFKYANENTSELEIYSILKENHLTGLPLLKEDKTIVDFLDINNVLKTTRKENHVVLMAGGKGLRLRPYTKKCPKPMLKINGKPMLEILIETYKKYGFYKFTLTVNYLKEIIMDYFEDGKKLGVNIDYIVEETPLGTAGSMGLLKKGKKEPLLIANGDVLSRVNPAKMLISHLENQAEATICVRQHEVQFPYGVIEQKSKKLVSFVEKPLITKLINTGIYVVNPKWLELIDKNERIDMPDLLKRIKARCNKVYVYDMNDYWIDVGREESLKEAKESWESQ